MPKPLLIVLRCQSPPPAVRERSDWLWVKVKVKSENWKVKWKVKSEVNDDPFLVLYFPETNIYYRSCIYLKCYKRKMCSSAARYESTTPQRVFRKSTPNLKNLPPVSTLITPCEIRTTSNADFGTKFVVGSEVREYDSPKIIVKWWMKWWHFGSLIFMKLLYVIEGTSN